MATLKVWETVRAPHNLPLVRLDERTTYQAVDFTGGETQSNPFDVDTSVVSVMADVNCALEIGDDPTATADSFPVDANVRQDFAVEPGLKLSVIAR